MSKSDFAELETLEEFRSAVQAQDRIVISDLAKSAPTVHDPACGQVKEEHFQLKVIERRRASGQYFCARNTRIAEEHGAIRCGLCYR